MTDGEVAGSGRDKGRLHRGWIILIVIGLYYATVSGLMVNCIGIVFAAILEDTGYRHQSSQSTTRSDSYSQPSPPVR